MHFVRVTSHKDAMIGAATDLYRASFPPHEQREEPSQTEILACPDYHFDLIYDGGNFVGELLYWEAENFFYVEHFCILSGLRGKRYGAAALELLGEKGKCVILEIDPPVDDISLRRKGFYERAGFCANPYSHIHPPYHAGNQGHELVVMSKPAALSHAEYDAFADFLKVRVMGG